MPRTLATHVMSLQVPVPRGQGILGIVHTILNGDTGTEVAGMTFLAGLDCPVATNLPVLDRES